MPPPQTVLKLTSYTVSGIKMYSFSSSCPLWNRVSPRPRVSPYPEAGRRAPRAELNHTTVGAFSSVGGAALAAEGAACIRPGTLRAETNPAVTVVSLTRVPTPLLLGMSGGGGVVVRLNRVGDEDRGVNKQVVDDRMPGCIRQDDPYVIS